ncbi:AAA family ATPase [Intestinibacter sp.]|uniref:AAA family ATPase n=1 Tax=Intestinibacter sp. TaxID=1965304 RepID=UPI003F14EB47
MNEFVRIGEKIIVKPAGMDYELIPGKVYDLKWDDSNDYTYLKENGNLNMPNKLYKFEEDNNLIKRCITYFNSDKAGLTTGVLLSGLKGSGKSILAKRLAIESNLPIIIVDRYYRLKRIEQFFKNINTPVCIILDEFEKNDYYWPTDGILTFLDGIQHTAKKLVIMTCNNTDAINDNLFDRSSRIRYWRKYEMNDNLVFVDMLINDKGIEDKDIVKDYIINNMEIISFDNVNAFLDEYIIFKDLFTLDQIFDIMNLTKKE